MATLEKDTPDVMLGICLLAHVGTKYKVEVNLTPLLPGYTTRY